MNPQYNAMHAGNGPPPPPMTNPPPQVFGGYSQPSHIDIANAYSDAYVQDDYGYGYDGGYDDDGTGQDGQGDPKRRRIARACDMCRKKKIKCDGKMPKCSHCENYKTQCIFTQVEKKRQPPKGAKYIEGLENRLGRMESLLRMSGLLAEDDGRTDLGTLEKRLADSVAAQSTRGSTASETTVTPKQGTDGSASRQSTPQVPQQASVSSPQSQQNSSPAASNSTAPKRKMSEREVEALADQMCSLVTNNIGETRYIGSSSGFSIFSPKGIEWVREKTGDNSFQDMIANAANNDGQWAHWKPEIFSDIFSRRTFQPLPPKQEALALLKDYFDNLNSMWPLFHEPTFMHLVHKHYSLEPYEGSGWWACLNVALALAHRIRVMSGVCPEDEDQLAWMYLKNAMAVQTELLMRNNDLLSIQALIGMALFLQGTPNPHPAFFLTAAAIRLSHSIGLHKRGADFHLNQIETEQRKRVFWIAYMLDKDICLRSGRPPAQDDDDMNTELPSEDPSDNIGNIVAPDGKKFNLFRTMCEFGQIQSRVYKQLYSVKASRQSDGELLNTIGNLDQELEEWKDNIPVDFRPEQEINAEHAPLILHVVMLHFAYYNCLTTIHRMSVHHGYWTSRLSDYAIAGLNARPLNPRVFMSASLCVNAARTSISLLKYIPHGDFACVWLVLYYPVSALVTLFANILQNPQDVRARSDLRLMRSVVDFLSSLSSEDRESSGHFRRMLYVCAEFERICRITLENLDRDIRGRGKRKQANKDATAAEEEKSIEQQQIETQSSYRPTTGTTPRSRLSTPHSQASPAAVSQKLSDSRRPSAAPPATQPRAQTEQPIYQQPTPQTQPMAAPSYSGPSPSAYAGASTASSGLSPGPWPQDLPLGAVPIGHPSAPMPNHPSVTFPPSMPQEGYAMNVNAFPDFQSDMGYAGAMQQQPFVPQDLWQMPMTLEWDWADVGAMGPGAGPPPGQQGGGGGYAAYQGYEGPHGSMG